MNDKNEYKRILDGVDRQNRSSYEAKRSNYGFHSELNYHSSVVRVQNPCSGC